MLDLFLLEILVLIAKLESNKKEAKKSLFHFNNEQKLCLGLKSTAWLIYENRAPGNRETQDAKYLNLNRAFLLGNLY